MSTQHLDGLCHTINQQQKDDPVYTKVLNEVRQGKPSKETLGLLSQRKMNESVTEIFQKLNEAGHSPVSFSDM